LMINLAKLLCQIQLMALNFNFLENKTKVTLIPQEII